MLNLTLQLVCDSESLLPLGLFDFLDFAPDLNDVFKIFVAFATLYLVVLGCLICGM